MSYTTEVAELVAATVEAQDILAQFQRKPVESAGNFTMEGIEGPLTGVLDETIVAMDPVPNGYEPVRQLVIIATVGQFTREPDAAGRPKIGARGRKWVLVSVGVSEHYYTLTCDVAS